VLHPNGERAYREPYTFAFQAGHIPSRRGSHVGYGLSPIAAVSCRPLLLRSAVRSLPWMAN